MTYKTSTINARINERTLFPYFVNDGMYAQKNYAFEGKDYSNFPRG